MKKFKKTLAILLAVMCLMTCLLAGCGDSGSNPSNNPGPGNSSNAGGGGGEGTQGQGASEITIGFVSTVDSIGPFISYNDVMTQLRYYFWEFLAVVDNNFELQPSIAESWETTDGGFTYEFKLYDYVTDSAGNPITADDVVFSYNTFKASGRSNEMSNVVSIEAVDKYTVRMALVSNSIGVLEDALLCPIVSKTAYENSSDEMAIDPIGTGRYVVESFEPASSIVFVKREDYWQTEELASPFSQANIDKMTFRFINDASQCAIAFETGDLDMVVNLPMTTLTQYVGNDAYTFEVRDSQGIQMYFSGDSHSPVSNDQKLRQAICYAIDNQGMIDVCNSGYGSPLYDYSVSDTGDFNPDWMKEDYYNFDPEKAKALVDESNYNGESIYILVPSMDTYKRYAQIVQGYLLAVGIKAEVYDVQSALYSTSFRDPTQYDLVLNPGTAVFTVQWWQRRLSQDQNSGSTINGFVDNQLQALLDGCSTVENHTVENVNACHDYITEQAYVYGLFTSVSGCIWRTDGPVNSLEFCVVTKLPYVAGSNFN